MPAHERLGLNDRDHLQDRRKPSIELDKEPAVAVGEPDPALQLSPQNDQLMSERRILCFKPALRLEGRDQDGKKETITAQSSRQIRQFAHLINADKVFGTHLRQNQTAAAA